MLRLLVLVVGLALLATDIVLASVGNAGAGIGFAVLLVYLGLVASFRWVYRR